MNRSRISDIYPHNVCHTFIFLFRGLASESHLQSITIPYPPWIVSLQTTHICSQSPVGWLLFSVCEDGLFATDGGAVCTAQWIFPGGYRCTSPPLSLIRNYWCLVRISSLFFFIFQRTAIKSYKPYVQLKTNEVNWYHD